MPTTSNSNKVLIEVCVDSVDSAYKAVQGGADRLEVCANLGLGGGTTPSIGLISAIRYEVVEEPWQSPKIPIMAMIRPRTGDFCYSESELKLMRREVRGFRHGDMVDGVVFGALNYDGTVDVHETERLVDAADSLEVCFHRAFDMTRNAKQAYDDISSIEGVTRILTSGLGSSAPASLPTLQSLFGHAQNIAEINQSKRLPTLMPGSGINPSTVPRVLEALLPLGLKEIHMSGGEWVDNGVAYRPLGMGMGVGEGEWGVWKTNREAVREVRNIVDRAS